MSGDAFGRELSGSSVLTRDNSFHSTGASSLSRDNVSTARDTVRDSPSLSRESTTSTLTQSVGLRDVFSPTGKDKGEGRETLASSPMMVRSPSYKEFRGAQLQRDSSFKHDRSEEEQETGECVCV